ncbi:HalOD1 output domain-containing protein [Natrinema salifodinae]|uniref:Halobacterial output domain-containing protein n=1 Tax=Natrinema salifodinae TaxID=1202768 RepID=A0A1I0NP75_9EURY|nr:HalOD1 output domain-containing protein [Natrinema salifodinae]SEW03000.1 hypothetical protein SAMN05216285_1941 [Natrinema salifodinae]
MKNTFSGSSGDGAQQSVSLAVVNAVAAHRDVDPVELPTLYEWIDPDALDSLFEPTRTGGPRRGRLEFPYDGHTVVVDYTDEVTITVDGTQMADAIAASPRGPVTDA